VGHHEHPGVFLVEDIKYIYQEDLLAGLAPATLNVYVVTISTSHLPFVRASVGRHPLVSPFFLHGPIG